MKITPELLKRYQANLCTKAEVQKVEEWLKSVEDEPSDLSQAQLDKMEQAIWENLGWDEPSPTTAIPRYRSVLKYAAAAIILFTVSFWGYQNSNRVFGDGTDQSIALKTINTQRGEKRTVTLSDGSTIRMNYETEIKAPEQFEGNERIVYLTGHAHFEVTRDTERPFIIYTNDSKTQVLGTSFDLNTKEEGATKIIVTSGKVAFAEKNNADNLVTLTRNDRAVLNTGKKIKTDKVDALALAAWKDNQLLFKDKTLKEIVSVLEPWFDVQVSVENPQLLDDRFSLSLNNPPLTGALERLAFMGNFDYQIDGKKVIIR